MIQSDNRAINCVLLDIEGTTTPIDFVHQTLFPFARKQIGAYVETHFDELDGEIEALRAERENDSAYRGEFDPSSAASVAAYLEFLIDVDRKSTPLKALQGRIWQAGYESGALRSEMFADVAPAFARWKAEGKTIAIFSSGSVLAQKLIFQYSSAGDLGCFIDAYFDTTTGPKRAAESYRTIAGSLNVDPAEILFVSDVPAELDAARAAGMETRLAIRPGNGQIAGAIAHQIVRSFEELE